MTPGRRIKHEEGKLEKKQEFNQHEAFLRVKLSREIGMLG